MKIYTKVEMCGGVVTEVTPLLECPEIMDTSDEDWDHGYKIFEHDLMVRGTVREPT